MSAGDLVVLLCSRCFDLAPRRLSELEADSVNAFRLTMRAPDLGYAPRFLGIFLALGFSRFDGESTLPPQAGNASRWAACFSEDHRHEVDMSVSDVVSIPFYDR